MRIHIEHCRFRDGRSTMYALWFLYPSGNTRFYYFRTLQDAFRKAFDLLEEAVTHAAD